MVVLINNMLFMRKLLYTVQISEDNFILLNQSTLSIHFPLLGKKGVNHESTFTEFCESSHRWIFSSPTRSQRQIVPGLLCIKQAKSHLTFMFCFVGASHYLKLFLQQEQATVKAALSEAELFFILVIEVEIVHVVDDAHIERRI